MSMTSTLPFDTLPSDKSSISIPDGYTDDDFFWIAIHGDVDVPGAREALIKKLLSTFPYDEIHIVVEKLSKLSDEEYNAVASMALQWFFNLIGNLF